MTEVITVRLVTMLIVFSVFSAALQLSLPIYSMQIFSRVVPTGHFATLAALFSLMLILNGCSLIIDAARSILISRWSLRNYCWSYVAAARATLNSLQPGEQPLSDLNTVRTFTSGPVAAALLDAPWSVIFVLAMFTLHKILGVITVFIFAIVVAWCVFAHYSTRSLRKLAAEKRHVEKSLLMSAHSDRQVAQAMGLRGAYLREMQVTQLSATSYLKSLETRVAWLEAGTKFLRNIFQVMILTTAAVLALTREVEVGAIVASTMLFSRALAPIERISSGFSQIADVRSAFRRLKQSVAKFTEEGTSLSLPSIIGRVTIANVSVTAVSRLKPILHDVNLTLTPGSVAVVVGAEGAGKSTLARVLCGALAPNKGEVRLDGFDFRHYDPDQLGKQIGYLPDSVRLEPGSVASTIARGGPIEMDAVIDAANAAGAHLMIQELPEGYGSIVEPTDISISAGQRQRIALARAFYRRPKLVILDEPTAHLDDEGERVVASAIYDLKRSGSTMIIVSRLPTLTHLADRLIYLQDGHLRMDIEGDEVRNQIKLRLASSRSGS